MAINLITGDDSDNFLIGSSQADYLDGRGGNDLLGGGDGDDVLNGGAGDDVLSGGSGNNTYLFGRGAGSDSIQSWDQTASKHNVIAIEEGLSAADIVVQKQGMDLLLMVANSADQLRIPGYFEKTISWSYDQSRAVVGLNQVEEIRFADGTRWDVLALLDRVHLGWMPVTPQLDDGDNWFATGAAVDGAGGNDHLLATGDDALLIGGSGNDVLRVDAGSAVMHGGSGDDTLTGGWRDDVLDGGSGDDTLDPGEGFNTIVFGRGAGHDTLVQGNPYSQGVNTIALGAGVLPGAVEVHLAGQGSGPGLEIAILGSADVLSVDMNAGLIELRFADGTVWDAGRIMSKAFQPAALAWTGTDAPEQYTGDWGTTVLNGGGGDDVLTSGGADAVLAGGDGNDTLIGSYGDDTFDGGAGNDLIDTRGGDGDVLLFGRESGRDVLIGLNNLSKVTVVFDAGIAPAELQLHAVGDDMVAEIAGASLQVTAYAGPWPAEIPAPSLTFVFADGTVWDSSVIGRKLYSGDDYGNEIRASNRDDVLDGKGGNDMLFARDGNDTLRGGDGDDLLDAGRGNDVLIGGHGNDFLHGEGGTDTYRFAAGDGADTILAGSDGASRIVFDAGILPSEVHLVSHGDGQLFGDLLLAYGTGDSIMVQNYLQDGRTTIGTIEFADGTVWDQATVHSLLYTGDDNGNYIEAGNGDDVLDGNGGNDLLFARRGNDLLRGGDGDDQLDAGEGDDVLVGGHGNDYLVGAGGADTYRFDAGDGSDRIDVSPWGYGNGPSRIVFGASVSAAEVVVSDRHDGNLLLSYGDSDSIVAPQALFGAHAPGTIEFADGTVWDSAAIHAKLLIGDDSDNVIEAYDGDNLLDGKGGNDRLTAFDGNDILRGGDGADLLSAGAGNNELVGGRGDDVLHGQGAVDIFRFEAGDGIDTIVPDYLVGAGSASRIVFGASVRPSDVVLSIDQTPGSEDLLLTYGSDAISVRSYAGIEQFVTTTIEFADGTVWNGQAIAALIGQPPASAMA